MGQASPDALEWSYVRAFERLGIDAQLYDWWHEALGHLDRLSSRRPSWSLLSPFANRAFRASIPRLGPDVVLAFKGLFVESASVRRVRSTGALALCVNPDNPLNPSATSTRRELRSALSEWDCYFTWGHYLVDQIYSLGANRVEYLPFAWDPDKHPFQPPNAEFRYPISFLGSYSIHREKWLRSIQDLPVHVWGDGWGKASKNVRTLVRGGARSGTSYSAIVQQSALSLNLLDTWNIPGHNMRTFELPGSGGAQVANASSEVNVFFEPGRDIATFKTPTELRLVIEQLLDSPEERLAMARRGHERVAGETFVHRAQTILEVCSELGGRT